jgi:hypothetical protein
VIGGWVAATGTVEPTLAPVHVEVGSREPAQRGFRRRKYEYHEPLRRQHQGPIRPITVFLPVGLDDMSVETYVESFDFEVLRFDYLDVGLRGLEAEGHLAGGNWLRIRPRTSSDTGQAPTRATTVNDFRSRRETCLAGEVGAPVRVTSARQLTGGASRDSWAVNVEVEAGADQQKAGLGHVVGWTERTLVGFWGAHKGHGFRDDNDLDGMGRPREGSCVAGNTTARPLRGRDLPSGPGAGWPARARPGKD